MRTLTDRSSQFTLLNAKLTDAGAYSVVVSNLVGASLLSSVALLSVLADGDGDRIADLWEMAFGLNPADPLDAGKDRDGDQMSNLAEYIAGTDPRDPLGFLRMERISAEGLAVSLQFLARSKRTYSVLFQDELASGTWSNLERVFARITNWTAIVIDRTAQANRFYRLLTPAQPEP